MYNFLDWQHAGYKVLSIWHHLPIKDDLWNFTTIFYSLLSIRSQCSIKKSECIELVFSSDAILFSSHTVLSGNFDTSKIRVLLTGTLKPNSELVIFQMFWHGTLMVATVFNLFQLWQVYHTECPPLFWFICNSWALYVTRYRPQMQLLWHYHAVCSCTTLTHDKHDNSNHKQHCPQNTGISCNRPRMDITDYLL